MYKKENKQTLNFWPLNDFLEFFQKFFFLFFFFYIVYIYFLNCGNSLLWVKK